MDNTELVKTILSAGGASSLVGYGLWRLLIRVVDTFTKNQEAINKLHTENAARSEQRASRLETKLDDCEKKHDDVQKLIGQLREDNGVLKGEVQTLKLFTRTNNNQKQNP
jgi:hypothetical protein